MCLINNFKIKNMKFLKKQILRSWFFIIFLWTDIYLGLILDSNFTLFGKIIFGILITIIFLIFTILLIVFLPIILLSFKYEKIIKT